jgi:hypothetical protein
MRTARCLGADIPTNFGCTLSSVLALEKLIAPSHLTVVTVPDLDPVRIALSDCVVATVVVHVKQVIALFRAWQYSTL